jgi:hypothetical protein
MAKIKRLLGHAVLEIAERSRVCHRNRLKHKISKGEICLVVSMGRFDSKNYCRVCALPMLEKADEDVRLLLARLNSGSLG